MNHKVGDLGQKGDHSFCLGGGGGGGGGGVESKRQQIQRERKRAFQPCLSEFIEPRVKVHLLDEDYAWVPKRRDFTEDPEEEILGNQNFRD